MENNSDILIYEGPDGDVKIDVRLQNETVWLTQKMMAQLFQTTKQNISFHIKSIFEEGELIFEATVKKYLTVQNEGQREVKREIDYYNLDMVLSVGYRVKSNLATQFRIWATQRLKEYIVKGFVLNDDRFKSGSSMNYFNELQERIREIFVFQSVFFIRKSKISIPPALIMPPGNHTFNLNATVIQIRFKGMNDHV